jgi:ABC-type multidrug transport system ATPase subunit
LLDEPLAHVDLMGQRDLAATIVAAVREHSMTALWVTHRPEEILPLADEASFLVNGRTATTMSAQDAAHRLADSERHWPRPAPQS